MLIFQQEFEIVKGRLYKLGKNANSMPTKIVKLCLIGKKQNYNLTFNVFCKS